MFERTLLPKIAIPFFDERNTQVDASNHKHSLQDSSLTKSEACQLVFLSCWTSACRGPSSNKKKTVVESWTVACSLDGVSFHTYLLESIDLLFVQCTQYPLFIFFFLRLARQGRALFKSSSTRREMLLTIFLFYVSDHHLAKSCVVSRFTFLNSILTCTVRQQWLSLF